MPKRPRRTVAVVAGAVVLACLSVTAGWASYGGTTANTGNTITAAADLVPPTVSAINIGSTTSGRVGHIETGGTYQSYASASDSSGISAVATDASAITSGQSAASMTSGSYSYGGNTYGWRSGTLTANTSIGTCTAAYSVSAADGAGSSATASGSAMVDRDLLSAANITLTGETSGGRSGSAVAPAGDVNGDGRQDLIVGADQGVTLDRNNNGVAYIVFGQASPATVDLGNLGAGGFRIDGPSGGAETGYNGATAGDVNADGRDDLLVTGRGTGTGTAYVVFGKATSISVDLASLGSGGYTINGAAGGDVTGHWVAYAGDVSGDGKPDQIIGAWGTDNNSRSNSGSAYVVFGKATTTAINLASLGTGGYRIDGSAAGEQAGYTVAGPGDVNGDGIPDVLVGTLYADANSRTDSGSAWLVFGKRSDTSPIDLASLGTGGRRIDGATASDFAGSALGGGKDLNGDGTNDLLIGAYGADFTGGLAGSVYVVFGGSSTTTLDLASLGSNGYRVDGAAAGQSIGWSVSAVGDMNGDGKAELVTGGVLADNNGRTDSGSAWVVFGTASTSTIALSSLGAGGFRIDGASGNDEFGGAVTGIPDANGDGTPDVLVGAKWPSFGSRWQVGAGYVVYGKSGNGTVDVGALGGGGFVLQGGGNTTFGGPYNGTANQIYVDQTNVTGLGDVNGDGLPDIAVGEPYSDSQKRWNPGLATVIFGQTSPTTVDLTAPGSNGFLVQGPNNLDGTWIGWSLASPGDVNGDGKNDILVGAPGMTLTGRNGGVAYVIYGRTATTTISVSSLGTAGYAILGAANGDQAGFSVANAGDVNADGIPDQLVGATLTDFNSRSNSGSAYVVFGKHDNNTVDLNALGSGGYRIDAAAVNDNMGLWVANGGDVNGDGKPDALIGTPNTDNNSRGNSGSLYVVFGKTSDTNPIDVASLGSAGYRIDGKAANDQTGYKVAGAGDLNGDGKADQLVSSIMADNNGRTDSGTVFVVFGKTSDTNPIDLNALGTGGYRIDGAAASDNVGVDLYNAGDINGDGKNDQLIAARIASSNGRTTNGTAWLIYGKSTTTNIDLGSLGTQGWAFDGAAKGDEVTGVGMLGDLNGDGRAEFLIGSPKSDTTAFDSGSVRVLYGPACP